MRTTTLGVALDSPLHQRLSAAAQRLGKSQHWLIKHALLALLDELEAGRLPPSLEAALSELTQDVSLDQLEEALAQASLRLASQDPQHASEPFLAFAQGLVVQSVRRATITSAYRRDEATCVQALLPLADMGAQQEQVRALAERLVEALRNKRLGSGVDGLIHEYSLSSQEGVALMCLAEALLRIPDNASRDALIRDKISQGDWQSHKHSGSLFVNAATWGLIVTGKLVATHSEQGLSSALTRLLRKGGEPLIRKAVDRAMRLMGEHFVTGQTIKQALSNSRALVDKGFSYSYDMLGEAAMTEADAQRYFEAYEQAIHAIGSSATNQDLYQGPGISIKLSALHPRYCRAQRERLMTELYPRVLNLTQLAQHYGIGITIDAEEAERLDISLDLLERLCHEPSLAGWSGIGFVVQAYQKRAPHVIDYLIDLARRSQRRLMIRLVKGAYWDSEIKRAQLDGLEGYPVFTRKAHTDVCYLACARKLLAAPAAVFPQFATHNAHTVAAIYHMAGDDYHPEQYEFQCLHGMGEPLYDMVVGPTNKGKLNRRCRIYAPVGTHETLLAYLVRRLLENGANSSFVHQLADHSYPIAQLVADPVVTTQAVEPVGSPHELIPLPRDLYQHQGEERRNARGLDLSNEQRLASLATALLATNTRAWLALPSTVELPKVHEQDQQEAEDTAEKQPWPSLPRYLQLPTRKDEETITKEREQALQEQAQATGAELGELGGLNELTQDALDPQAIGSRGANEAADIMTGSKAALKHVTAHWPSDLKTRLQDILNPADHRDVVGQVVSSNEQEIAQAVALATEALTTWGSTPTDERCEVLLKASDLLEAHQPELLSLLIREAGKSYSNAIAELREAVDFLRYYAAQAKAHHSDDSSTPLGLVVCISPWNFPLAIFLGQVSAALAVGNVVLAKPAEQTPLIAAYTLQLLYQAGLPKEVAQLLPGDGEVGAALVARTEINGVMFTGSTEVARHIATQLAQRLAETGQLVPLVAETGGINAMIVDSSALPEQVTADVLNSAFDSAGQRCSALRLLCLQEEVAETMLTMIRGATELLAVGQPDRLETDVGPVIDEPAQQTIETYIEQMRQSGFTTHRMALPIACQYGTFVAPTLIEVNSVSDVTKEVFGPVLHVLRYTRSDLPQLIQQLNTTGYALTFGVHSRIDETIQQLSQASHAGNIYINRNMVGAVVGVQPFGGQHLSGTGPKAGGPLYLRRLVQTAPALNWSTNRGEGQDNTQTQEELEALAQWLGAQNTLIAEVQQQFMSHLETLRYHAPLNVSMALPTPTGEKNTYQLRPRGQVLCVAQSALGALVQLASCLVTGNQMVLVDHSPEQQVTEVFNHLPEALSTSITPLALGSDLTCLAQELASHWRPQGAASRLGAALVEGDALRLDLDQGVAEVAEAVEAAETTAKTVSTYADTAAFLQLAEALANHPLGVIQPQYLSTEQLASGQGYVLERLCSEHSISINTAAAGGNAHLMALI